MLNPVKFIFSNIHYDDILIIIILVGFFMDHYSQLIVIEGLTAISAIIQSIINGVSDRKIVKMYIADSSFKKRKKEIGFIYHKSKELDFEIEIVDDKQFPSLVNGKSHGGIAALCTSRTYHSIKEIELPINGIFALLDGIEDPYNYAYTVRSLYASGFDGIILPPRNWSSAGDVVVKSSAGTTELIPTFVDQPQDAAQYLKSNGYKIVCAGIRDSVSLFETSLKSPLLLIIGGEKRGISRSLLSMSDQVVRIDYGRSFLGSLTTASSAAVMAFEIMRQNK